MAPPGKIMLTPPGTAAFFCGVILATDGTDFHRFLNQLVSIRVICGFFFELTD
jgi:hypothetical protein